MSWPAKHVLLYCEEPQLAAELRYVISMWICGSNNRRIMVHEHGTVDGALVRLRTTPEIVAVVIIAGERHAGLNERLGVASVFVQREDVDKRVKLRERVLLALQRKRGPKKKEAV